MQKVIWIYCKNEFYIWFHQLESVRLHSEELDERWVSVAQLHHMKVFNLKWHLEVTAYEKDFICLKCTSHLSWFGHVQRASSCIRTALEFRVNLGRHGRTALGGMCRSPALLTLARLTGMLEMKE